MSRAHCECEAISLAKLLDGAAAYRIGKRMSDVALRAGLLIEDAASNAMSCAVIAAKLACSLGSHAIVWPMPNALRTAGHDLLQRRPAERASTNAKVLVYTESWGMGGIESSLLDVFELFADDPVDFTLLSVWKWSDIYDNRLQELGVDIVFLFDEQRSLAQRSLAGWHGLSQILSRESYDVVHLNAMNGAGLVYAPIAKVYKVPQVVAHARNSRYGVGHHMTKAIAHALGKAVGAPAADVRLAVSREAGRFMFGDRVFSVLKRGIDMERYAFDLATRNRLREQLGIGSDTFVVGNIGRVSQAKNPLFQVRAFAEFHRRVPDSLLLLVGDGELRAQRDDEIKRLGLEGSVVVRGASPNPAPYYFAMDCLIVPSLYEGLPNSVLEAQCAGLSVLASDTITEEAFATSIAYSCSLGIGEIGWAQVLEEIYRHRGEIDRMLFAKELERAGFTREAMYASLREAYALSAL